ncbi:hypothetical protein D3C74_332710 [compost metagenome]
MYECSPRHQGTADLQYSSDAPSSGYNVSLHPRVQFEHRRRVSSLDREGRRLADLHRVEDLSEILIHWLCRAQHEQYWLTAKGSWKLQLLGAADPDHS